MAAEDESEQEEVYAAAREAAQIGGAIGDGDWDPAERPVIEAGGGEAEGFEQTERALMENASHANQQSAHAILHDQGRPEELTETRADSEADTERSSELEGGWS
jgi:hypothetical protein